MEGGGGPTFAPYSGGCVAKHGGQGVGIKEEKSLTWPTKKEEGIYFVQRARNKRRKGKIGKGRLGLDSRLL